MITFSSESTLQAHEKPAPVESLVVVGRQANDPGHAAHLNGGVCTGSSSFVR